MLIFCMDVSLYVFSVVSVVLVFEVVGVCRLLRLLGFVGFGVFRFLTSFRTFLLSFFCSVPLLAVPFTSPCPVLFLRHVVPPYYCHGSLGGTRSACDEVACRNMDRIVIRCDSSTRAYCAAQNDVIEEWIRIHPLAVPERVIRRLSADQPCGLSAAAYGE